MKSEHDGLRTQIDCKLGRKKQHCIVIAMIKNSLRSQTTEVYAELAGLARFPSRMLHLYVTIRFARSALQVVDGYTHYITFDLDAR